MIEHFEFNLVGPFRIRDPSGVDCTPRLRKARAILAILCLSPQRRRARQVVQDLLWSDRSEQQGSASLRGALSELRKAFGGSRDIVGSDRETIWLDRSRLWVDVEDSETLSHHAGRPHDRPILLEDLDLRDPEFETWLRDQRSWFEARLSELQPAPLTEPTTPLPDMPRPIGNSAPVSALRNPWVCLDISSSVEPGVCRIFAESIGEAIVHGIARTSTAQVVSCARSGTGIEVKVDAHVLSEDMLVHLSLWSSREEIPIWSTTDRIALSHAYLQDGNTASWLINQAIEFGKRHLRKALLPAEEKSAFAMCSDAISMMFEVDPKHLNDADEKLDRAFEMSRNGILLAWRSYLRTFSVGEFGVSPSGELVDEAESYCRLAMELEPGNATVLALASYVHSFILRRYEVGHELAQQAVRYDPREPLAHAYLARSKLYLGDHEESYRSAKLAREIAGPGVYRYKLDFMCGIAALVSGRFEEAVRLGELVASAAPSYRPPLRYLIPLYLHFEERDRARTAFDRLSRIEPGFSLADLHDPGYPAMGVRQASLPRLGDVDL